MAAPFTSAQLATEINTDPKALGLVALKNAGNDNGIANILNATYAGVGIVWRSDLAAREILAALVWAEVSGFTAAQVGLLNAMLVPGTVDATQASVRAFFGGLFAATTTLTNLTAVAKVVAPSRAQELWGQSAVISAGDVSHAFGRG